MWDVLLTEKDVCVNDGAGVRRCLQLDASLAGLRVSGVAGVAGVGGREHLILVLR